MKTNRIMSTLILILLLLSLLAGCAKSMDMSPAEQYMPETTSAALSESDVNFENSTPVNQKLIRTVYLDAETEDLDALLSQISERITELSGYVESRDVYNGSSYNANRYRRADLVIRIPADRLDAFVDQVADNSNIVSNRETAEDVTLDYVATQSRIVALETEQARLLELLAQAKDMEDLLLIETRLTEVRTELERVTSQLRLYDNRVNYGTIHLNITEVRQYTVIEEPESVWQRIGKGFVKSLKGLWTILTEIFVFLIVALPYLLAIGAVATGVLLLIRYIKKKEKPLPPSQKTE